MLWHKMEMFGPPKRGNGALGQRDEGHQRGLSLLMVGRLYILKNIYIYHRLQIFPKCITIMSSHRIFIVVSKNHSIIMYIYIYV